MGPFSPGTMRNGSQSAWKSLPRTRGNRLPPLTTSPAQVCWVNQGLQPVLWELQTQSKGYRASQGHDLALGSRDTGHRPLGLAAPSTSPQTTIRHQIHKGSDCPKPFRAAFLPGPGWARGTPPLKSPWPMQRGTAGKTAPGLTARPTVTALVGSVNMMCD